LETIEFIKQSGNEGDGSMFKSQNRNFISAASENRLDFRWWLLRYPKTFFFQVPGFKAESFDPKHRAELY
jgi:hypothetical protein